MQIALVIGDRDRGAGNRRRAQTAPLQLVVAPYFGSVALAQRHHDAVRLGHEQILLVDRQAAVARHVVRPPDLTGVEREHGGAALKSRGEHVVADDAAPRSPCRPGDPVPCGRAARRARCPTPCHPAERHGHHLAVVESAHDDVLGDHRDGRAAQAQARHLLLDRPQLLAAVGVEAVQSAVDRAHHHRPSRRSPARTGARSSPACATTPCRWRPRARSPTLCSSRPPPCRAPRRGRPTTASA